MGLADIIFGPFERFGMMGGVILLLIVAIIGGVLAAYLIVIGANILAAVSYFLGLTFTYGMLALFLYVMWYRRPK
ncbi:MAG: hypothetical protein JSW61_00570 [Candidatus Thorarchaeota archaeon]|nr:MAG: hypothetical protein JSW61_00570 [Candidatus Thorarchaeota archaeon]